MHAASSSQQALGRTQQHCTVPTRAASSRPLLLGNPCNGIKARQQQELRSGHLIAPQQSNQTRQLSRLYARQQRRSPVIAPDIVIGEGEEEAHMELMNYLLRQRIVFVSGYIDDKVATQVVGSLLALEAMDEEEDIRLYINSPGGMPYSVIGVVDTIQAIKPQVVTVALGACYSYSSLLLAAGTKGKRFSMKNTRIMMTQPMGGSQGNIYAIRETVKELNAIYQLIARYYMRFTDMTADEVERNTCRDCFMTPEEAQEWNLIDGIINSKNDATPPPSVYQSLQELGFVDRLSGGMLRPV